MKRLAAIAALGTALGALSRRIRRVPIETDSRARGRLAQTPMAMTWLGWKDIALRTWHETFDDRLMSVSASVAFFGLMALVPSLSVLISLYGLVSNPGDIERQLAPLFALMPSAVVTLIMEQAHRIAGQPNQTLSLNLMIGLAIAVWSANAGIKALFDALNIIYEEEEKRSVLKLHAISLLTTLSAAILMVLILLIIAAVPAAITVLPFSEAFDFGVRMVRWPAFFLLATVSIAILYWVGPSRRRARFIWVLPGAFLAALLWAGVSALFSFYATQLGNYEVTYGSLSAVIVFMTWLWISAIVILIGAELNSELEHQTLRDTTEGKAKPLGARGATMADNIGPGIAQK